MPASGMVTTIDAAEEALEQDAHSRVDEQDGHDGRKLHVGEVLVVPGEAVHLETDLGQVDQMLQGEQVSRASLALSSSSSKTTD